MQLRSTSYLLASLLALCLAQQAGAQETPRRLGAITVCTCDGSHPMTAFQVYEWWGTAVPKYPYQLKEAINARIGCGEGKGCMVQSLIPDVSAAAAVETQYQQLNRSIRKKVRSSISGQRIITGSDGVAVLRIEAAGSSPVATTGNSTGSSSNSTGSINVSTADMSQYTQNASQGVMILYYGAGGAASNAYLYELKGPGLSSKSAVADELGAKIAAADPFIGYELLAVSDCASAESYIKKKAGNSIWVHCNGTHTVK